MPLLQLPEQINACNVVLKAKATFVRAQLEKRNTPTPAQMAQFLRGVVVELGGTFLHSNDAADVRQMLQKLVAGVYKRPRPRLCAAFCH